MIQIIISNDPSTQFLLEIVKKLKSNGIEIEMTEIFPNVESYFKSFEKVSKFEKDSIVVFLGHGTDKQLYGGELLPDFEKKVFVDFNQMNVFEGQKLFLLACNSAGLIKSSFRLSKFKKSIGFGALPTSKEEIKIDKKKRDQEVSLITIEDFKSEIVATVSNALTFHYKDFNAMIDYLSLMIDQRINNAVLEKKDRNLADLLFNMRNEMQIY